MSSTSRELSIQPSTVITNNEKILTDGWWCLRDGEFHVIHCDANGILGSIQFNSPESAGMHAKIDYIRNLLSCDSTPDVVCITESKLCKNICDSEISIQDYKLFRKDRNRVGGGVLIYCKYSLQCKQLLCEFSSNVEFVAIKADTPPKGTAIICCVYRLPSSKATWINEFNDVFNHLSMSNVPVTLLGDFNMDLL